MKKTFCISICMALFAIATISHAQNVTGSIVGVVRDPTGAVVPGATVRATNTGTSATFQASSNSEGQYAIRTLPIGEYKVEVEASGFKKFETTGIRVLLDEAARWISR